MEVRIESTNNVLMGAKLFRDNLKSLNLIKLNSNDAIAKMNLAYNNPTKAMVKQRREVVEMAKTIDFNYEYKKMEQAYMDGYKGFNEIL